MVHSFGACFAKMDVLSLSLIELANLRPIPNRTVKHVELVNNWLI